MSWRFDSELSNVDLFHNVRTGKQAAATLTTIRDKSWSKASKWGYASEKAKQFIAFKLSHQKARSKVGCQRETQESLKSGDNGVHFESTDSVALSNDRNCFINHACYLTWPITACSVVVIRYKKLHWTHWCGPIKVIIGWRLARWAKAVNKTHIFILYFGVQTNATLWILSHRDCLKLCTVMTLWRQAFYLKFECGCSGINTFAFWQSSNNISKSVCSFHVSAMH